MAEGPSSPWSCDTCYHISLAPLSGSHHDSSSPSLVFKGVTIYWGWGRWTTPPLWKHEYGDRILVMLPETRHWPYCGWPCLVEHSLPCTPNSPPDTSSLFGSCWFSHPQVSQTQGCRNDPGLFLSHTIQSRPTIASFLFLESVFLMWGLMDVLVFTVALPLHGPFPWNPSLMLGWDLNSIFKINTLFLLKNKLPLKFIVIHIATSDSLSADIIAFVFSSTVKQVQS